MCASVAAFAKEIAAGANLFYRTDLGAVAAQRLSDPRTALALTVQLFNAIDILGAKKVTNHDGVSSCDPVAPRRPLDTAEPAIGLPKRDFQPQTPPPSQLIPDSSAAPKALELTASNPHSHG